MSRVSTAIGLAALMVLGGCTQEQQNQWRRDIQNWTGTNGILEIYAGDSSSSAF